MSRLAYDLLIVFGIFVFSFAAGGYLARRFRMPDHGWKIALVLFSVLAAATVLATRWPPGLGIDLKGGVILVYEVDPTKKEKDQKVDMDELVLAITKRVNPGGQREVTVRKYGEEQIEVIIPRAEQAELDRIKGIISQTGSLEFRILCNDRDHEPLIKRAEQNPGARELRDSQGRRLAWWVPVEKGQEADFAGSAWETAESGTGGEGTRWRTVTDDRGNKVLEVLVWQDQYDVKGDFLDDVRPDVDEQAHPCVAFRFDRTGAQLFGRLTGDHIPDEVTKFHRRLGIILNGALFSAPNIKSIIYDRGQISMGTRDVAQVRKDVDDLVRVLKAGKLPAALTKQPISELVTGPTLGEDLIRRGTLATVCSIVLVFLFMAVYYRAAGLVACGAMLLNLSMVLALMITIHAELTLSGFAGLVLGVGMAVDANVLIYERMREELDRQATLRMAIRNGFHRALSAIVDSNVTTIITALVLYYVGTDQIKGFAITLLLGVLLSMYTGVFCSRVVFDVVEKQGWLTRLRMMRMLDRTNINFLGARRVAVSVSAILIVIGLAGAVLRGQGLFNIDFTGGVSVEVVFNQRQDIAEIRKSLGSGDDALPDLAVSDVQSLGEEKGLRFLVNTSLQAPKDPQTGQTQTNPKTGQPYSAVEWVEEILLKEFSGKLSTNSLTVESVKPVAATEKPAKKPAEKPVEKPPKKPAEKPADQPGEKPEEKPGAPAPKEQGRADLPADSLLASAGAADFLLAEAGPAPPEPAEKPAEPVAEKPAEKPEPKPEEKPAEKPESPPEEKPKAEEKPAEKAKPEDKPADEPKPQQKPEETPGPAPGEKPVEKPKPEEKPAETPDEKPAAPEAEEWANRFAGGSTAVLKFAHRIDHSRLEALLGELVGTAAPPRFEVSNPDFEKGTGGAFTTWTVTLAMPPAEAGPVFEQLNAKLKESPYFPSSNEIGGKVAQGTRVQAVAAMVASLFCIIVYIWVRFQRLVYGLAAVVSLLHDVAITLGAVAVTYWLAPVLGFLLIDEMKIGLDVLAAFLTLIGYSLNDTIVIFDRIREVKGKSPLLTEGMINRSVNETLARTIITGGGAIMGLLVLYLLGGQGIHAFAFTMLFGVVTGTFSSVYIAAPVLLWMAGASGGTGPDRAAAGRE